MSGRAGCTILIATHTAEEVLELCHRVAVLHRGRVLATGPVSGLAAAVADQRIAVWTSTPEHPALALLGARCVPLAGDGSAGQGWTRMEVAVPGGHVESAAVLGCLAAAGVQVSRFEPVALPLAELIERVMRREEG